MNSNVLPRALLLSVLCCSPVALAAEERDSSSGAPASKLPPGRPLAFDEALRLARSRHPLVAAARMRTLAAEARRGQARSAYYPQVHTWVEYLRGTEAGSPTSIITFPDYARVGGSNPAGVRNSDSFNNFIAAATVRQLIYDFGRTQGTVASQEALVAVARMTERLTEQTILNSAGQAFYGVLAGREDVRVSEESVVRTQGILDFVTAGNKAGLRPPNEVARAQADSAAAKLALIRANASLDVARLNLANALGAPDDRVEPVGAPALDRSVMSEEKAREVASTTRPEVQALLAQKQAMKETLRAAKAGHLPTIEATGGLNVRGQFAAPPGVDELHVFNWDVGLLVHVPIFQGFAVSERVNEVSAELRALEHTESDVRQTIALEVKQALLGVASADQAAVAAESAIASAKLALDISESRYRTGLSTIVEVTEAQAAYVSAQASGVRAVYETRTSRALLQRALGTLAVPPKVP